MNPLARTAFLSIFSIAAGGAALLLAASLVAQPRPSGKTQKLTASAIQIERTDPPEDLLVPEAFRVSTYENVIREVTKTNKFQHVIGAVIARQPTCRISSFCT